MCRQHITYYPVSIPFSADEGIQIPLPAKPAIPAVLHSKQVIENIERVLKEVKDA